MPYSPRYEGVYLAFIAGLAGFGMVPTAAVKDPSSRFQLDRIFKLVAEADYSFHDVSHMSLDKTKPCAPRLNMAFELGLAVATARLKNPNHQWFVFDTHRYRVIKALSDLGGVTVRVHDRSSDSVLRCLIPDDHLMKPWQLRVGGTVVDEKPRYIMISDTPAHPALCRPSPPRPPATRWRRMVPRSRLLPRTSGARAGRLPPVVRASCCSSPTSRSIPV